jgi:hypothetical protein
MLSVSQQSLLDLQRGMQDSSPWRLTSLRSVPFVKSMPHSPRRVDGGAVTVNNARADTRLGQFAPTAASFQETPMTSRILMASLLLNFVFLGNGSAGAQELSAWLPGDLNAVLSINIAKLHESPLAKRENWSQTSRDAFVAREAVVPPGLDELVIGAELDLQGHLTALRTFVVAKPLAGMTLEALAALAGAPTSQLDGHPAAETRSGGLIVQSTPEMWLGVAQGGRQAAARWLRTGPGVMPTSLAKAMAKRKPGSQISLAVDLDEVVTKTDTDRFLSLTLDTVPEAQRAKLTSVLASVESVTLSVTVTDAIRGELAVEFGEAASELSPHLPTLVPALLQHIGAASEELEAWTWTARGTTVIGRGELSAPETRNILSIVRHSAPELASPGSASAATSPGEVQPQQIVAASKRYLASLKSIMDDLQASLKKSRDNHALWHERAADKINDLPLKNVDPELLDYGQKVASSFRYQAQTQRMAYVKGGVAKAQSAVNQTNSSNYVYASGYNYSVALPYRGHAVQQETGVTWRAIDVNANATSMEVRLAEWKQIDEGYLAIRRRLTEKLMAEF